MNYHDPRTWTNYDAANQAALRIEVIRSYIPSDVRTILDAGCGNGLITNELARAYDITGIDSSAEALKYLKCHAQQASVTKIPFPDKSFDLVMCNEVLEHLDDNSLHQAISELKRISAKYIIISVPDSEQLAKLYYRCAKCGFTDHPYGHLQSISINTLNENIGNTYLCLKHLVFGPPTVDFIPWLLNIKHKALSQWFSPYEGCVCSNCGSNSFDTKRSLFSKAINGINRILIRPRPFWLIALYQRSETR